MKTISLWRVFQMVYQSSVDDCGQACVRNLLCLLFHEDDFCCQPLMKPCKDFFSIRTQLEQFDCHYTSFEVDSVRLLKKEQFPCIALVKNGEKTHFVVLGKMNAKKVSVVDPQFGAYDLTIEEFEEVFLHRMLLKDKVGSKPVVLRPELLLKKEKISYLCCFAFECLCLLSLILSTGFENPFVYSVLSLTGFLVLIILQNALSRSVLSRMEKDYFYEYMEKTRKKEDFAMLHKVFTLEIKRCSYLVSYGVMIFGLLLLLTLNSYFLSFLSLISMLFVLSREQLKKEKNKTNRFCSIKEEAFLSSLEKKEKNAFENYEASKKRSRQFYFSSLLNYLLEASVLLIFIFFELTLREKLNIHLVIYSFGLSITLSVSIRKLFDSMMLKQEEYQCLNALSYPFPLFLLKTGLDLKYNSREKGEFPKDGTQICPRVCESGKSSEELEKYF